MAWNDEMDKICREGAARRLSASQIADEIGAQTRVFLTRNAVIGYAHRKGIDISRGVPKRPKALIPFQKKRSRIPAMPKSSMVLLNAKTTKPHRERARINFGLLAKKPLTLLSLDSETCRWPLWPHMGQTPPDQMFYCGSKVDDGSAYCHTHHIQALPGSKPREPRSGAIPYRS